jgi:anaerobic selenocysteine-containing dehydrogenase
MADETANNNEGTGLNRRNFLKSAGVAVAGGTLGAGLTLPTEAAVAAAVEATPTSITNFRCPICSKDFNTYQRCRTRSHRIECHRGHQHAQNQGREFL